MPSHTPPNPNAVKCEDVAISKVFTEPDGRVCEVEIKITRSDGSVDEYTVLCA